MLAKLRLADRCLRQRIVPQFTVIQVGKGDLTAPHAPALGVLTERMSLPVTVHETFEPVELIHTPAGELVFDMGQEFTGIFTLRVQEPAGTKIHIQTGEIFTYR